MCTEEKRMGMVMGEAKAEQLTAEPPACAADEELTKVDAAEEETEQNADAAEMTQESSEEGNPKVDSITIEIGELRMICPIITSIGEHVSRLFDGRVEFGSFSNDEDDIVIDLLKRMYRRERYFEALELLELTFLLIEYYEPVELLDIVRGTGDPGSCRAFLKGFINASARTDLDILRSDIALKDAEDNRGGTDE